MPSRSPPLLRNRVLVPSIDRPGFDFRYEECVKRIIFCTKWEPKNDYVDWTDKATRVRMRDIGFRLAVLDGTK